MATNKSRLEAYLNRLPLLEDEKAMWYRLGFYISASPTGKDSRTLSPVHTWCDYSGNVKEVMASFSTNIRTTVLEWWQAEKLAPRTKELGEQVEVTPFDDLEIERG